MMMINTPRLNSSHIHGLIVEDKPASYFINDQDANGSKASNGNKFSSEESKNIQTILIVDDDPDVLSSTSDLFQILGFRVLEACSGEVALEIISKNSDISFLLSDVLMPGLNGIQLARKVREIHPSLRIVLASGYPLPALRSELGSLDEFAFINKPYSIADIAQKFGN